MRNELAVVVTHVRGIDGGIQVFVKLLRFWKSHFVSTMT